MIFICIILGMVIALIIVISMLSKLKTVHKKRNASDYTKPEDLHLRINTDTFLNKEVKKAARSSDND